MDVAVPDSMVKFLPSYPCTRWKTFELSLVYTLNSTPFNSSLAPTALSFILVTVNIGSGLFLITTLTGVVLVSTFSVSIKSITAVVVVDV